MAYQKPEAPAAKSSTSNASGWLNMGVNLATKFLESRQDTHHLVDGAREKFRTNLKDADFDNDQKALGGNPLHWASGPNAHNAIQATVKANFPVNQSNKLGQTPLHIHCAKEEHLSIVVTLLAHQADASQSDKEGNTPLHIACQHGHVDMAKLLIVFGTSVSARNLNNATPWDLARSLPGNESKIGALWRVLCVGDHIDEVAQLSNFAKSGSDAVAVEISTARTLLEEELKRLDSWRPFNDKCMLFDGSTATNKSSKGPRISGDKLLALDGGGMRGLILIILLMELEMLAGRAAHDMFDWLAGTSTGGILVLALCTGKSLYHCLCLYLRLKNIVFSDAKPHVLRNLEMLLQEEFGTEMRMCDLPKKPRVMIAAAMADRNPPTLHLFRNYVNPNVDAERETSCIALGDDGKHHMCSGADAGRELVWKAARNTALAPTYFIQLASDEPFMDGGVMANNPTMAASTEISKFYCADGNVDSAAQHCPLKLIVSLGTGKQPTRFMSSVSALKSPTSQNAPALATQQSITAVGTASSLASAATSSILSDFSTFATGYVKATHMAVAQLTDSEGLPVEYSRTLCKFGRISFFRFSPQLEQFVELDCINNVILADLMWRAKAYVRLGRKAEELVVLANHLRRWCDT